MGMRRSRKLSQRSGFFNRISFKITPRISAFLLLSISILLLFTSKGTCYSTDKLAAMEQIGMERNGINANWRRLRNALLAETPSEPYSLPRAKGFTGSVRITGEQTVSTDSTQGNISFSIMETFAGNMIDTYLYFPSTGEFVITDRSMINTLSTGMETGSAQFVPLTGENTLITEKTGRTLPDGVPVEDEVFPGFYSGVIGGSSAADNMELKISSPGLLFPYENKTIFLRPISFAISIPLRELRDLQPGDELIFQSRTSSSGNKAEVQVRLHADEILLSPMQMSMEHILSAQPGDISQQISFQDKKKTGKEGINSYVFYILRGKDKVSFSEKANPLHRPVPGIELLMLRPSKEKKDVLLEMEKTGKNGIQGSALISLTLLKPERLRSSNEREIETMGFIPFTDYRQLLMEGRAESRAIPGSKSRKIVDGYSRTFVYTVVDQFGSPLKTEGLHGRSVLVVSSDDVHSGKYYPIPERLGYHREKPDSQVFIKQIVSDMEGRIIDVMDLAYYEATRGIAPGKEIHLKQEIYLMGWYLGERDIYFEKNDIRTGPWRKNQKSTM